MIEGVGVHIKVGNFAKSLAFYEALGFEKVFEYGPNKAVKEDYDGIVFEHGGTKLEITNGHRAVKPAVFRTKVTSSKISLMINVDSLADILARAKRARIAIAVAPRHYYWGKLELVIKDPDGTVLVFTTPYSKSEAKRINADESFGKQPTA